MGGKYSKVNKEFIDFCRKFGSDGSTEADMDEFLEREGVNINYQSWTNCKAKDDKRSYKLYSPLIVSIACCCTSSSIECVELLLKKGADPNKSKSLHPSPIWLATTKAVPMPKLSCECVKLLLKYGATIPNELFKCVLANGYSKTPYMGFNAYKPMAKILHDHGARINLKRYINYISFGFEEPTSIDLVLDVCNPSNADIKCMISKASGKYHNVPCRPGAIASCIDKLMKALTKNNGKLDNPKGVNIILKRHRDTILMWRSKSEVENQAVKEEPNEEQIKIVLD